MACYKAIDACYVSLYVAERTSRFFLGPVRSRQLCFPLALGAAAFDGALSFAFMLYKDARGRTARPSPDAEALADEVRRAWTDQDWDTRPPVDLYTWAVVRDVLAARDAGRDIEKATEIGKVGSCADCDACDIASVGSCGTCEEDGPASSAGSGCSEGAAPARSAQAPAAGPEGLVSSAGSGPAVQQEEQQEEEQQQEEEEQQQQEEEDEDEEEACSVEYGIDAALMVEAAFEGPAGLGYLSSSWPSASPGTDDGTEASAVDVACVAGDEEASDTAGGAAACDGCRGGCDGCDCKEDPDGVYVVVSVVAHGGKAVLKGRQAEEEPTADEGLAGQDRFYAGTSSGDDDEGDGDCGAAAEAAECKEAAGPLRLTAYEALDCNGSTADGSEAGGDDLEGRGRTFGAITVMAAPAEEAVTESVAGCGGALTAAAGDGEEGAVIGPLEFDFDDTGTAPVMGLLEEEEEDEEEEQEKEEQDEEQQTPVMTATPPPEAHHHHAAALQQPV